MDYLEFLRPRRPLFIINGRRVRKLTIDMHTHPPIPIEKYLLECHRPAVISATRINGILREPDSLHIYQRKSGRWVYQYVIREV